MQRCSVSASVTPASATSTASLTASPMGGRGQPPGFAAASASAWAGRGGARGFPPPLWRPAIPTRSPTPKQILPNDWRSLLCALRGRHEGVARSGHGLPGGAGVRRGGGSGPLAPPGLPPTPFAFRQPSRSMRPARASRRALSTRRPLSPLPSPSLALSLSLSLSLSRSLPLSDHLSTSCLLHSVRSAPDCSMPPWRESTRVAKTHASG